MKFVISLVCMLTAWSGFAQSIDVSGETVRGITDRFVARVSVTNIPNQALGTLSEQAYIESRVFVIVESYDNLKVPFTTPEDDALAVFAELISHDIDEDGEHDIVADIEIRSNTDIDIFKDDGGNIFIGACLRRIENGQPTENCDEDDSDQQVVEINAVVNDAPTNLAVTPRHLQLTMTWDVEAFPSFLNSDDTTLSNRAATKIYAFAVKSGEGVTSLEAREFLGGPRADDTEKTCAFNDTAADGQSCITCDTTDDYLDIDAIKESSAYQAGDIKIVELDADDQEAAFLNLDENINYISFVTYAPDAIQRSACYSGMPYKGLSWTELNGGTEAKTGVPCFIATAAYGSAMAKDIDHLRWFREHYLMNHRWGRAFVSFYYTHGPRWAAFIEKSPWRRQVVRTMLWPVVQGVVLLRKLQSS